MNTKLESMSNELRKKICNEIEVRDKGVGIYQIITPFTFDDGDGYVIYLKQDSKGLILTDNGHTLMHLSYWMDTSNITRDSGVRADIFNSILNSFKVEYSDGELLMRIYESNLIADYFFSYLQAITKITDIDYLNKERVRRTFLENLVNFMKETYGEKVKDKWSDPQLDREGIYSVDVRLDIAKIPFFIFAVWSDERALNVVVSILTHKQWKEKFRAIVIHEYMDELSKTNLKKITDFSDKQISSFYGKEQEIKEYIETEKEYIGIV